MKTPPLALIALISVACTETVIGPAGPQGAQGPQGSIGAQGESGYVFEYSDVSFTSPSYEVFLSYPDNFEGLDSDVAIVYVLWEVNDQQVEIWRPLPHILFVDGGTLQYGFDFTKYDVRLFLDANFNMDILSAAYTDNFVARVVVVPGSFWDSGRVSLPSYYEIEMALGLPKLPQHDGAILRPH